MYQSHTNPQNENEIIMMERYESRDALQRHKDSDAFNALGREMQQEDLGSIASIDVYDEIGHIGFPSRS